MNIDEAKNLAYMLDRTEYTKQFMVKTNPPVSEPVVEFAMDTAGMPREGFQGA